MAEGNKFDTYPIRGALRTCRRALRAAQGFVCCADKPGERRARYELPSERSALMQRQPIVGTITGVFHGILDGMPARLVRRGKVGYTVELLASRDTFHKGDYLALSPAEFAIDRRTVPVHAPRQRT